MTTVNYTGVSLKLKGLKRPESFAEQAGCPQLYSWHLLEHF